MAKPDLFLDSSGLYGALDRRDATHESVARLIRDAVLNGAMLVSTDYVIAESLNLAVARRGHHVAIRMLDFLRQTSVLRIEPITPEKFDAAEKYFRRHHDKSYSFTDCTSFVVMKDLGLQKALTTDHHFNQAGFIALLES